jgi:BlaI family transcriptional regulator, penicillinase repressor
MPKPEKNLSPLENEILRGIWEREECTAEEIRRFLTPDRRLTDSTVRTVLRRMEEKGFLAHRLDGRRYLYRTVDSPESMAARAVGKVIQNFFAGSVDQFLLGLVSHRMVSREQLDRLKERIAEAEENADE